jgi:site-specific recombinase XerD
MVKHKSIKHQMDSELLRQYRNGRGHSRSEFKGATGNFADYSMIYSDNSLKTHRGRIKQFSLWLRQNHAEIREVSQITRAIAAEWVANEQDFGKSAWTVSSDLLAVNRVMVGSSVWGAPMTKKEASEASHTALKRRRLGDITHSRRWSASEWVDSHQSDYDHYREQVELARAFGLRRAEILGSDHYARGVRLESFWYDSAGTMRVSVVGKGGRFRAAPVLDKWAPTMARRYGRAARRNRAIMDKQELLSMFTQKRQLYQGVKHDLPFHIFRSEYAVAMYGQLKSSWPNWDQEELMTINGFEGPEKLFEGVSQALGHNRTDVLKNYLR